MRNFIIFYSSTSDPLIKITKENKYISCISVDSLIPYLHIGNHHEPIKAIFPEALLKKFKNSDILNRNFSYDGTKLSQVLSEWGVHTLWCESIFHKLISLGRNCWHDTSVRGISRSLLPLNTQWFLLKNKVEGVSFPKFSYGFGKAKPALHEMENPLQKSIWSLFDWKIERALSKEELDWNQFFVDQPQGRPLVISYINSTISLIFPKEQFHIDEKIKNRCINLTNEAKNTFRSRIGEILVYVQENGEFLFCAFSPFMLTASNHKWFQSFLNTGLGLSTPSQENVKPWKF